MATQYYCFQFSCHSEDLMGNSRVSMCEYIHTSEEEARQELISSLKKLGVCPRELQLVQKEEWHPSPFEFD
jgi:hypothetical protein